MTDAHAIARMAVTLDRRFFDLRAFSAAASPFSGWAKSSPQWGQLFNVAVVAVSGNASWQRGQCERRLGIEISPTKRRVRDIACNHNHVYPSGLPGFALFRPGPDARHLRINPPALARQPPGSFPGSVYSMVSAAVPSVLAFSQSSCLPMRGARSRSILSNVEAFTRMYFSQLSGSSSRC